MTAVFTGGALLVDKMTSWKCKGERKCRLSKSSFTLTSKMGRGRFAVMFIVRMSNLRNMVEKELNEVHLIQSAMGQAPSSMVYRCDSLVSSLSREISWFIKAEMESFRSRLGVRIPLINAGHWCSMLARNLFDFWSLLCFKSGNLTAAPTSQTLES